MAFGSMSFLFGFLPAVLLCYFLCPTRWRTARNGVLLVFSLVFYCWGGVRLLPAFAVSCVGNWAAALLVSPGRRHRKAVYAAAVVLNLLMLGYYKYTGFLLGNLAALGMDVTVPSIALPAGISFFTFQAVAYLTDVYRGTIPAERNLGRVTLFMAFFPQLLQGPILRYGEFGPALLDRRESADEAADGAVRFCFGLAKKVLLADNLGVLVNNGWSSLSELTALTAWCVILGYTLQLYFDFSGYCDLAAGCARLLGLRLPINFDSPYRSLSVTEFWKRWHMTLTAFLRENVYFPLGGSRKGRGRTYLNILVVYLVSGIWHGAGWTFILWGLLHGLAQVLERLWGKRRDALPRWVRWAMTFLFINLAWVFFRAPDVSSALLLLKTAVTGGMGGIRLWLVNGLFRREISALELLLPVIGPYTAYLRVALILGIGLLAALWPRNVIRQMDTFRPNWRSGLYVLAWTVWAILSFTGVVTFIYSNF